MADLAFHIDVELSGSGNGWTALDDDVLASAPIQVRYGIDGSSPLDRVAGSGSLSFGLDNSSPLGRYTPGHANVLAGFDIGIGVRLRIEYSDLGVYEKWRGVIDSIDPTAGVYGPREVAVSCVDWMDEAARTKIRNIPVQINQRSDQVFRTIVENVPRQPPALEVGYGMEQYAYSLDQSQDEGFSVLTEFQKLADSELGFIYVKGSSVTGGVLTFEDRRRRGTVVTSVASFATVNSLRASRSRDAVINRVMVLAHPRRVQTPTSTFDPTTISGLTCWLRADSIPLNDGDVINSWEDESGLAHHFTALSGKQPLLKTGIINGHDVARFDGVNDRMGGPALNVLITNTAGTIFVVFKQDVSTSTKFLFCSADSQTRMRLGIDDPATTVSSMNHDGTPDVAVTSGITPTNWNIAMWDHDAGAVGSSVNNASDAGRSQTASGATSDLTLATTLGAFFDGTSGGFNLNGDIAEVMIWNVALTEAERKNVESYLANKYDITLPYEPTGIGTTSTVIFSLDQVCYIPRFTSRTFKCPYKNSTEKTARIGAIGQIDPEATTDYLFNADGDGGGEDRTSQLSFSAVFGGNSSEIAVTNNGPQDGFLTFFQIRGLGVFDDGELILEAEDVPSRETYGENLISLDMAYQSDPDVSHDAAYYLLAQSRSNLTGISEIGFIASASDELIRQAITREISDRIDVFEEMTAVDAPFFINGISLELDSEGVLRCVWTLVPAVTEEYLILDSATQGQIDVDKLAYGLWNRFWILGIAVLGADTRVNP